MRPSTSPSLLMSSGLPVMESLLRFESNVVSQPSWWLEQRNQGSSGECWRELQVAGSINTCFEGVGAVGELEEGVKLQVLALTEALPGRRSGINAEVSPEERAAESVPVRVGLRSSERAPLARLPFFEPTLSEMRVMEPRVVEQRYQGSGGACWRGGQGCRRHPQREL